MPDPDGNDALRRLQQRAVEDDSDCAEALRRARDQGPCGRCDTRNSCRILGACATRFLETWQELREAQ